MIWRSRIYTYKIRLQKKMNKNFRKLYYFLFFFIIWFVRLLALRPLLAYWRVIVKMIVEKQMECRLAGETEVLLSSTKSHMTRPGFEPGPPRWEAGD
jgi:hypothetical protein